MANRPQQNMRDTRRAAPPPEVPDDGAARGTRVATNLGQGLLRPGAGALARRLGQTLRCGTIVGNAYGYEAHPNRKDEKRTSYRFVGDFMLVTYTGDVMRGSECYLPSSVERTAKAILDMAARGNSEIASVVPIAVDVWCEGDDPEGAPSPMGYRYVCYDIKPAQQNDSTLELAYRSGAIDRPAPAITDQSGGALGLEPEIDPETGEVMPGTAAQAA